MNKIATFLSEKLAGKLDDLAHRDMREWPPYECPHLLPAAAPSARRNKNK